MRWLLALVLTWLLPGVAAASPQTELVSGDRAGFDRGVAAYRRGDYAEAEAIWGETLLEQHSEETRARLYYNLGNAAWRQDEAMKAVGWYSACLRIFPRHADAWHNLELVRAEAGLDPADRGDLRSTTRRALLSLRPEEARLLALLALAGLALLLALEAFVGGELLRWLSLLGALGALVLCLPFLYRLGSGEQDPMLVVRAPSVSMRSEPATSRTPIGELDVGEEVERVDSLPGWIRVTRDDGTRGWVQEEALFPLRP